MSLQKMWNFDKVSCECGREHTVPLKHVLVKRNAIEMLPEFISEFNCKKAFLIADPNTFCAAGERVSAVLEKSGISYNKYLYPTGDIEPDEDAVGSAVMHFDKTCDIVIGIGSGVINDIGKILANLTGLPYFIVGTAPSMDGYASATSSMNMDGLKVSLPSKCPDVIIGDIDVLKNAPLKMLKSGFGDMLAKYVSIAEWRISHEITGEYYCERVAELIREALRQCVNNAAGLLNREEAAVTAVFEGLVLGGAAMSFAKVSRPASGVEHYISHIWDMRSLEFGTKSELHGIQCAVATTVVAGLYEKLLEISIDKETALAYVNSFSYDEWSKTLKAFVGKGADAMMELEKKERKYNLVAHARRLDIIIEKWDKIRDIIREEIPTKKEIEKLLDSIGAPKMPGDIGLENGLKTTFLATKDIRDKYVLSRLLWDVGRIDELFSNIDSERAVNS